MTGTEAWLDLQVELDGQWVEVPVRDSQEAGEWAAEAVDRGLRLRGATAGAAVHRLYVQTYAALLEMLRSRQGEEGSDLLLLGAYAFAPGDDLLPWTTVEVSLAALPEGWAVDRLLDSLVAPEDQRFGDPGISDVGTRAGEATKVKQLLVVDAADGEQEVHTSLLYVWALPEHPHAVVVMSAYFASAVDGELCEQAVDDLAASLLMEPST